MTISTVLTITTPNIGLEPYSQEVLSGIMFVSAYLKGADGNFPAAAAGTIPNLFTASQDDWTQFAEILAYSGHTPPSFQGYLQTTSKAQVITDITKWIREVLLPKLVALINGLLTTVHGQTAPPVTTTGNYVNPIDVLTDAVKAIKFTLNADGTVSATI